MLPQCFNASLLYHVRAVNAFSARINERKWSTSPQGVFFHRKSSLRVHIRENSFGGRCQITYKYPELFFSRYIFPWSLSWLLSNVLASCEKGEKSVRTIFFSAFWRLSKRCCHRVSKMERLMHSASFCACISHPWSLLQHLQYALARPLAKSLNKAEAPFLSG